LLIPTKTITGDGGAGKEDKKEQRRKKAAGLAYIRIVSYMLSSQFNGIHVSYLTLH